MSRIQNCSQLIEFTIYRILQYFNFQESREKTTDFKTLMKYFSVEKQTLFSEYFSKMTVGIRGRKYTTFSVKITY